jgi:hypothetical protein
MPDRTQGNEDAASRLWWGVRRYPAVVVAVLVLTLAVAALSSPPKRYQATALVTAFTLEMDPASLPRLGQTVFVNGAVADAVIAGQRLDVTRDRVIPDRVSLEPTQDSIVFVVRGTDASASVAAALANTAASAFVLQLNKPGAGLGTFGVQEPAAVPVTPVSTGRSLAARVLLGGVGGLALAMGMVALLVGRRRPIIDVAEAAVVCGTEPLGTLCLPPRTGGTERPAGVSPLVRVLRPTPGATWTFVGCGDTVEHAAADRLRGLVASMLSSSGELAVVRDASEIDAEANVSPMRASARRTKVRPLVARPHMIVKAADGAAGSFDPLRGPGPDDRTVLVVCDGTRAVRAAEVASDFLPNDVSGVVFVERGSGRAPVRRMLWTSATRQRSEPPDFAAVWPLDAATGDADDAGAAAGGAG